MQDNIDLMRQMLPTLPTASDTIPTVIEEHQPVKLDRHFPPSSSNDLGIHQGPSIKDSQRCT